MIDSFCVGFLLQIRLVKLFGQLFQFIQDVRSLAALTVAMADLFPMDDAFPVQHER